MKEQINHVLTQVAWIIIYAIVIEMVILTVVAVLGIIVTWKK